MSTFNTSIFIEIIQPYLKDLKQNQNATTEFYISSRRKSTKTNGKIAECFVLTPLIRAGQGTNGNHDLKEQYLIIQCSMLLKCYELRTFGELEREWKVLAK